MKKLKSLLDSGAITKEEFEEGRRALLGGADEGSAADQLAGRLRQLKRMHEDGTLSDEEYEEQKGLALDRI